MESLAERFAEAEEHFASGAYEEALRGYVSVIEAAPRFTLARYRVADCLLNLGDSNKAHTVYRNLAQHYIKSGNPLLGLVLCKMVTALEPLAGDLIDDLADLYSRDSARTGDEALPVAPALPPGADVAALHTDEGDALRESASRLAADTGDITETPENFPQVPLFTRLERDAFIRVLHRLRLRRFEHDDLIVREGERGDSLFLLANGQVTIWKTVDGRETQLARLSPGAVFGEMALVTSAPRTATVRSVGDVDVLELTRADLEAQAGELESVHRALEEFTRERFLANLAATSSIFRALEPAARREVLDTFEAQSIDARQTVIEEGAEPHALFLVLRGEFRVSRKIGGVERSLATLRSGQVFGEMALLRDRPTSATVRAMTDGEVLVLKRERFEHVLRHYPDFWTTLHELSERRLQEQHRTLGSIATVDSEILV